MKRIHAFEIHDQSWCPNIFRNFLTDMLQFQTEVMGIYDDAIPLVQKVLDKTSTNRVIDLCSGGSGPWGHLAKAVPNINVVLTDKFPNGDTFEKIAKHSKGQVTYETDSIDAMKVPESLSGMRTIFTALHHFRPDEVSKILQDAVNKRSAIGVFEFTERRLHTLLLAPLGIPLTVFFLTLCLKPFKFSRLFWTFVIPVIPLMLLWDGIVSHLRTYTVTELKAFVEALPSNDYQWEIAVKKTRVPGMKVTYLLGYPTTE